MFSSMIIFDIICSGVYYDYMFSIVDLPLYSCMESYSPHLDHLLTWVNSKDSVSWWLYCIYLRLHPVCRVVW
jgi:hypothetical protein